jgi:hypothetical protein
MSQEMKRTMPSPALQEIMAREEADTPFGGWGGEELLRNDAPPPPAPEPLRIDPPDWEAELAEEEPAPAPAIAAMLGDDYDPPAAYSPRGLPRARQSLDV